MNAEELDKTFAICSRMIRSRAVKAAAKAATIGSESLAETIADISDSYLLTKEQRNLLSPDVAIAAHEHAPHAAAFLKSSATARALLGRVMTLPQAGQAAGILGRVKALAGAGLTVGKLGTKGVAQASKGTPWVAIAVTAWAVGNGGFFWHRARAYNQACYDLLKDASHPGADHPSQSDVSTMAEAR